MTNIRFVYLYRDASNYKQRGEAIFFNEKQLPWDETNVREDLAKQLAEHKRVLKQRLESGREDLP